jgi:SPP1 gp7 family putative phage head morphogenesis protein
MAWSVEMRKDPQQQKTLVREYERDLNRLWREFTPRAVAALRSATRELEVDINITRLAAEISVLMERGVYDPAALFVVSYAEQSYMKGVIFSKMSLGRVGIEASGQMLPVDWRAIDSLKVRNLTALKGITEETNKEIIREVSAGMQKGEGADAIARRIRDSVDDIGRARSMTMARTETSFAFNDAALIRYRQYGITKVEWLTGQDEKVCSVCGPRDGRVYPIGQAPECPAHPNCRCTLLAARDDTEVTGHDN